MTYMSMGASFRGNGNRHAQKAEYWRAVGKPEYAEGSMRKAERNWKKADYLEKAFKVPLHLQAAYDATMLSITKALYDRGTGGNPFQGIW